MDTVNGRLAKLMILPILGAAWPVSAMAADVTVIIENLSPNEGTFLTPTWIGFHDGSFDLYNSGEMASTALERLAEDGNTAPLMDVFSLSAGGSQQATLVSDGIPPLAPGETTQMSLTLDEFAPESRYFSYASMVIPSNDAFIANGNPAAHQIFDADGTFLGADFFVVGVDVLDAGTEVNDELPANTAFFGQAAPDTGVNEGGVVGPHPGFLPAGSDGILDDPMFANADFLRDGYPVAQIRVVPEPATLGLALLGGTALLRRRGATMI